MIKYYDHKRLLDGLPPPIKSEMAKARGLNADLTERQAKALAMKTTEGRRWVRHRVPGVAGKKWKTVSGPDIEAPSVKMYEVYLPTGLNWSPERKINFILSAVKLFAPKR